MKTTVIALSLAVAAHANDTERIRIIREVNEDPSSTWTASISPRFAGTDFDVVKNLCGALIKPDSELRTVMHHAINAEELVSIPDNFDSREAWPNCESIKEIRDQADCGSCWAFGAVEAASDRICIATNGKVQTRLSPENLVSCCDGCGYGCQGGFPKAAWDYFVHQGVPSGGLYGDSSTCQPYSMKPCDHHTIGKYGPCPAGIEDTPKCRSKCDYDSTVSTSLKEEATTNKFSESYYIGSHVSQIQKEIMTNGPVEAAFTVYADFESYTSGVYQHKTGSQLGGHAVKILGWGVEDETPYWLVANSWNEDWGEDGFFRIKRGHNECGIESQIVAGTYTPPKNNGGLRNGMIQFFDDA